MNRLRRGGSSLEGVQTILLCALRDQGKGKDSHAWLLLGLAALVGQDLGLHSDSASAVSKGRENGKRSVEELAVRRRVWGVTFIPDLFLSLQLSRPSAIVDAHFFFDCPTAPTSSSWLSCTPTSDLALNLEKQNPITSHRLSHPHHLSYQLNPLPGI